jgi:hypothetical protein
MSEMLSYSASWYPVRTITLGVTKRELRNRDVTPARAFVSAYYKELLDASWCWHDSIVVPIVSIEVEATLIPGSML